MTRVHSTPDRGEGVREDTLDAVFSLLPSDDADRAIQHLRERAEHEVSPDAFEIHWAEFELSGQFVRGGISDIADLSTRVITNSQSDVRVNLLASRARAGDLRAGLMEWCQEHELFVWYLPYRFFNSAGKAGTRLRGLVIDCGIFSALMEQFNDDLHLTTAEKRTLFQLVTGLQLREAAATDGVTYETKRAHTKAASDKFGCTGQKDLIRVAIGQMVQLMSISDVALKQVDPAVELVDKYLYDDMQLVVRHHRSGAILRYLVGGPAGGTPAIMVHGMMFPVIVRGIAKYLDRHNIRLIMPIRTGYMESRPLAALFDQVDLVKRGSREIEQIVEAEGLGPVALIGNSLGAIIALQLAMDRPDFFLNLVLLSPNLARPSSDSLKEASTFYKGMHNLKSDSLLFKLVNLEYRKFYASSQTCRHILKTHFAKNATDLQVMDGLYSGYPVYDVFAYTYASSIVGIAEDFMHVMNMGVLDATNLSIPLTIIHGEADPLTSFAEIEEGIKVRRGTVKHRIGSAGHFASASHADEVWGHVSEARTLQSEK